MFGLTEIQYNFVKRAAKNCISEIRSECDKVGAGKKGAKFDEVSGVVISKYHSQVKDWITRTKFTWIAGYLNGQFDSVEKDYE